MFFDIRSHQRWGKQMRELSKNGLLVICASAAFSLPALSDEAGDWMADELTGCEIWSVTPPQPGEGATWSGACVEGQATGQGSLVWWDSKGLAGKYLGDMQAGKVHGKGWLHLRDDATGDFAEYIGSFDDGRTSGKGVMRLANGSLFYGEILAEATHGRGLAIDPQGRVAIGEFKDGKGLETILAYEVSDAGEQFFGEAQNGMRHGYGVFKESDAETYSGHFENGELDGPGVLIRAGEGMYLGEFSAGRQTGFGTAIGPEGNIVQGRFEDGQPVGAILVTETDGTQTVIEWEGGDLK
jgi:hypothetical protein